MLLTHSLSVPLDILNNRSEAVARIDAKLHQLYGDWARLTLPPDAPQSLIHWGTRLRFWISDGLFGYEVDGTVVAHEISSETTEEEDHDLFEPYEAKMMLERLREGESSTSSEVCPSDTSKASARARETGIETIAIQEVDMAPQAKSDADLAPRRVIVLRLLQCRPIGERRTGPRRWQRFSVRFHPLREPVRPEQERAVLTSRDTGNCWERSWAIDISAGGLRLRTYALLVPRQRLALQFWLPDGAENRAVTYSRCFALCGRVLRSQRIRTRAEDAFETTVGFEQLSGEDGLALSHFLSS